jgi:outer membrane receptor protein involved in Fe transport
VELEAVVVEARRSRRTARFEESAGLTVQELSLAELRSIPGLAEPDPVRAMDVLPGVTRVSDFTAVLNVRGGSGDQNLILMDRMPLFHPYHLLGIFSVFNPDMVQRAELRSGGFPAEYGGRASSVLLVESDVGDGDLGVDAGLGLISSRLAIRGGLPIGVRNGLGLGAARWKVSARRSYWDLVTRLTDPTFPYSLRDFQAVFEGWTKGGDRVRVNAYSGRDKVHLRQLEFLFTGMESVMDEFDGGQDSAGWDVRWPWGNDAVGASWTHLMPGGGVLDVHGSLSRFSARFNFTEYENIRMETEIGQSSLGADLELRPTPGTRWKSGVGASNRETGNVTEGFPPNFQNSEAAGWESSAYTQMTWTAGPRWLLEGGVRWDHWRPRHGPTTAMLSPRAAVKRFLGDGRWAVRMAGGRYTQFLHSLRDERIPISLDAWVLAGEHVPALVSDQIQAGVEGYFGSDRSWFAAAEGYHRTYDGVVTQNWADDPADPADDLLPGEGRSWGIDVMVRKNEGRTRGWVTVSFLKANRTFEDTDAGLVPAPVIEFPPVFDRRLEIDLAIQRDLPWGVEAGLRLNVGTGLPYTRHLARYRKHEQRLIDLRLDDAGANAVLLGPRNGARLPAYHRLDVSFRKTVRKSWGSLTPYLSVINVYNRDNVLWFQRHYRRGGLSTLENHMLPILPTAGVEVSF